MTASLHHGRAWPTVVAAVVLGIASAATATTTTTTSTSSTKTSTSSTSTSTLLTGNLDCETALVHATVTFADGIVGCRVRAVERTARGKEPDETRCTQLVADAFACQATHANARVRGGRCFGTALTGCAPCFDNARPAVTDAVAKVGDLIPDVSCGADISPRKARHATVRCERKLRERLRKLAVSLALCRLDEAATLQSNQDYTTPDCAKNAMAAFQAPASCNRQCAPDVTPVADQYPAALLALLDQQAYCPCTRTDQGLCASSDPCQRGYCTGTGCAQVSADGRACASDNNLCTTDVCSNGACTHPARTGQPCTDADKCQVCDANAACGPIDPMSCLDTNPCTADSCDPAQGCVHLPVADGTACTDDGNPSTQDVCRGGTCVHLQ